MSSRTCLFVALLAVLPQARGEGSPPRSNAAGGPDMIARRWTLPPGSEALLTKNAAPAVIRFDLSGSFGQKGLPKGAKVYAADLRLFRSAQITGRDDEALESVEVYPLFQEPRPGEVPAPQGKPLELRGPWFDRLDATSAVRDWSAGKPNAGFLVKACPRWAAKATCLEIAYEGKPGASDGPSGKDAAVPQQVKGLRVLHRAGQTFITFGEIDDRSADASPTWGDADARLGAMDANREVRYRMYRHVSPITAASLHAAELLGEVLPMSGYNVRGRSVDQLICLHRRRAIDDLDLARKLARGDYFSRYNPDMPEMREVRIGRLAIEDGKSLPPGLGLYVHQPPKAQKAFYAVVSVVNGVANTRDFSAANSLAEPVAELPGPGEPVLQGQADVTVFYDYPGRRLQYVQWVAPPLANLPNQYCNWGVFVPRGFWGKPGEADKPEQAKVRRLSVFFHDARQRFLKPPWPHRQDTVLLSPHDAPWRSYGYGYHEALGTLRSFRQGQVQPFFARRVDAMVAWALRKFDADAGSVSCGGRGYWGGTAAIQYGLRRPGTIAYVMAEDAPDPDPRQTPYELSYYGRDDRRKTDRPQMDAVWGRPEWEIPAESGKCIWDEMNLVAYVQASGPKRTLPYLSLGAGSMHLTWPQEAELMKAYLQTHNAFMAEFFWGSSAHLPLPVTADQGDWPFEPRADRPLLACNPKDRGPNPDFFPKHFETGHRGYSGGGRLNTRPRWDTQDVVDEPDRLEMSLYCARRVVYAGRVTCDVAIRNTRKFRPKPGEKLAWTLPDPRDKRRTLQGEATVDDNGHIVISGLTFGEPGRLVVRRPAREGGDR